MKDKERPTASKSRNSCGRPSCPRRHRHKRDDPSNGATKAKASGASVGAPRGPKSRVCRSRLVDGERADACRAGVGVHSHQHFGFLGARSLRISDYPGTKIIVGKNPKRRHWTFRHSV